MGMESMRKHIWVLWTSALTQFTGIILHLDNITGIETGQNQVEENITYTCILMCVNIDSYDFLWSRWLDTAVMLGMCSSNYDGVGACCREKNR